MNRLRKNVKELSFLLLLLLGALVFVVLFEAKGIENNTPEAMRCIAFFLPGVGLLTAGFLYEVFRKKENTPELSVFYIVSAALYLFSLLLMVIFPF